MEYSFSLVTVIGMSHLAAQLDAVLPGEPPHAGRGEDLEVGGQGAGPHLEADLVVALAGAAVGDVRWPRARGPRPPGAARSPGRDSADTSGYLPS